MRPTRVNQIPTNCQSQPESSKTTKKIMPELLFKNKFLSIYSFNVKAREWEHQNLTSHFVTVQIDALNSQIFKAGQVHVFMSAYDKHLKLPLRYFQLKRALNMSVEYKLNNIIVKTNGSFVLNINSSFNFIVLVVEPKLPRVYRQVNWVNYEAVKKRFKVEI